MKNQIWEKSNNFKDNKNDDEKQAHFSHSVSGFVAGFLTPITLYWHGKNTFLLTVKVFWLRLIFTQKALQILIKKKKHMVNTQLVFIVSLFSLVKKTVDQE